MIGLMLKYSKQARDRLIWHIIYFIVVWLTSIKIIERTKYYLNIELN